MKTATRVPSRAWTSASSGPGASRGKVGRANGPVGPLEDLEDLVLAVDVVAHGHDVDAGLDQLLEAAEGQPRAAGGVLGVADDQADPPARDQPGQGLADDLPAGRADDVADEQDLEWHARLALSFKAVELRAALPSRLHRERCQRANSTDAGLAQDGHLDLAGIAQLVLDRPGDVAAEGRRAGVVEVLAVHEHPDLAARLDGVGLLDAREAQRQGFQLLEPPHVFLQGLAASARPAGADGVGRRDQHGVGRVDAEVVVMPEGGVDDLLALAVALGQLGPDGRVAPFHLVVGRLADVVKQPAAPPERAVEADLLGHHAGQERNLERVPEHVLGIAGAELEPAQVVEQLLVQADDVRLLGGLLAEPADVRPPSPPGSP